MAGMDIPSAGGDQGTSGPSVARRKPGRPPGRHVLTPDGAARFAVVVRTIRRRGEAAGFRKARDLMFQKFEVFAKMMPAYAVAKLAMEFSRHAMFCDVANQKADAGKRRGEWKAFQDYLHGATDIAFEGASAEARSVDEEVLEESTEEEEPE